VSGIALFSEVLANFEAARCKKLDKNLAEWGGIEAVYALVWPNYEFPVENHPLANRVAFAQWRKEAGVPLWAWFNCSENQQADAEKIDELDRQLHPDGWLLDIEGEWVKGAGLDTLIRGAVATGKPVRASLAAATPSHVEHDYRCLDRNRVPVDFQCYFDSGEGPLPAVAVSELYQSSFVVLGWQYRHRVGGKYGWGRCKAIQHQELAIFDSYLRPGPEDSVFGVLPRDWGWTVDDRILWPNNPGKPPIGLLMGRAAYASIRVTLDVTRGANDKHSLAEWKQIAASARIPNARKRPISVYKAENATDGVLAAIAEGAA